MEFESFIHHNGSGPIMTPEGLAELDRAGLSNELDPEHFSLIPQSEAAVLNEVSTSRQLGIWVFPHPYRVAADYKPMEIHWLRWAPTDGFSVAIPVHAEGGTPQETIIASVISQLPQYVDFALGKDVGGFTIQDDQMIRM